MFLDKIKVIAVLVFGLLLGGVGAGFFGLPGSRGEQAIQAAQPCEAGKLGKMNDEIMQITNRAINAAENAHPMATMFNGLLPVVCVFISPSE